MLENAMRSIENIMTLITLMVWIICLVKSHNFYVSGKENRFKFRLWFNVGMLNVTHIILSIIYRYTLIQELQEIRWMCFALINVSMFEILSYSDMDRTKEMMARVLFYSSVVLNVIFMTFIPMYTLTIILIFMSMNYKEKSMRRDFVCVYIMYAIAMVVPSIFGYTKSISLFFGMIYSVSSVIVVNRLFVIEKMNEIQMPHFVLIDYIEGRRPKK